MKTMKKMAASIALSVVALNAASTEWYEGGDLHKKTMSAWCAASQSNKLATAADFVSGGYNKQMYNKKIMDALAQTGMDGIRYISTELVKGLDASACDGSNAIAVMASKPLTETTALLIAMMGWLKN